MKALQDKFIFYAQDLFVLDSSPIKQVLPPESYMVMRKIYPLQLDKKLDLGTLLLCTIDELQLFSIPQDLLASLYPELSMDNNLSGLFLHRQQMVQNWPDLLVDMIPAAHKIAQEFGVKVVDNSPTASYFYISRQLDVKQFYDYMWRLHEELALNNIIN